MVRRAASVLVCLALVLGAFAGSASAKKLTKKQQAKVRAELRKQVRSNPAVLKRRSFLRRAGLVDFKLPVTIRLRNVCDASQNLTGSNSPGGTSLTTETCRTQGTALNQRIIPSARVNLGPSLGFRDVAIGGALAAVVEFNDTYDGGALGNVNLKILPGNKTLTTSSVPLLWNDDITRAGTRSDVNWLRSLARPTGSLPSLQSFSDGVFQGCGDWTTAAGTLGTYAGAPAGAGYKALFYDVPWNFGSGTGAGLPGYQVNTAGGSPSGAFLPIFPGVDNPQTIQAGGVIGNNDWIGPNPFPFPSGSSVPGTGSGGPASSPSTYGGAADTVLRTSALSLGIAPGGVSVNMSTGTPVGPGSLPTAQGSQDVTLGYSGGQANLFGTIPGKNVGIDVTVNLATKINAIARIMDHDVFKQPGLIEGEEYPAAYFNCRQVFTGAVQNYIPGVRLTGSLRIAPAITKDGKVRIAKASVASHSNDPDRVALSACLFPSKPYNPYGSLSSDTTAVKIPSLAQVTSGTSSAVPGGTLATNGNAYLPFIDGERYPNLAEGYGPTGVPCGVDSSPELADVIRKSGLTGTVSGMPTPSDPAFAGVVWSGSQATVAGDITVNPLEVDVLLGDQPTGT